MKTWRTIFLMSSWFTIGCGQLSPNSPPVIVSQRNVSVSSDDPIVEMEDGTRIGVDGVPSGQSMQFMLTQYKDSDGRIAVGVDAVSEPMTETEQR